LPLQNQRGSRNEWPKKKEVPGRWSKRGGGKNAARAGLRGCPSGHKGRKARRKIPQGAPPAEENKKNGRGTARSANCIGA